MSATKDVGFDDLYAKIEAGLQDPMLEEVLALSFAEGRERAWLFANNLVTGEEMVETGYNVSVSWTAKQKSQFGNLSNT